MNWAAFLVAILPAGEPVRDTVSVIERNFVYDHCGKPTMSQWVWWQGRGDDGDVRAWRLARPEQRVERDWQRGGYVMRFWDGETFREIRAASYRVRHTQYDVEVIDRDYLPKEKRRGLSHEQREDISGR